MKNLYTLKLHEHMQICDLIYAVRVPGGWLYEYTIPEKDKGDRVVFVPYNEEFKKEGK